MVGNHRASNRQSPPWRVEHAMAATRATHLRSDGARADRAALWFSRYGG